MNLSFITYDLRPMADSVDIGNRFCVCGLPLKHSDHSINIGYMQWVEDAGINAYQIGQSMYFNRPEDRTLFLLQFA